MYHAIICKLFQCMLIEIGCVGCLKNFPSCVNDRAKEVPIGGRPPPKTALQKAAAACLQEVEAGGQQQQLLLRQENVLPQQPIIMNSQPTFKSNRLM